MLDSGSLTLKTRRLCRKIFTAADNKKMKKKKSSLTRHIVLLAVFVTISLVYLAKLISIQIAGRDFYELVSTYTYKRTQTITAQRGEIFDRNGVPLVTNEYSYNLIFDYASMPAYKDEFNGVILKTLEIIERTANTDKLMPTNFPFDGTYPDIDFSSSYLGSSANLSKLKKMLITFNLDESVSGRNLVEFLLKRYGLVDGDGKALYTNEQTDKLLRIRYDMESKNFSTREPYILANNVDISLITKLKEPNIRGISTTEEVTRRYNFPGYASHILGRVGKIYAEDYDYYKNLGYSMDATVGVLGAEKIFESHLRGIDGKMTIIEDAYGNILEQKVTQEPVAGKDVWLTLDINMQVVAENALAKNIALIVENAAKKVGTLDGEDCKSGALTVLSPYTGEILAMASYPTFDLSSYGTNYTELSKDPIQPLFNRALNGLYPPGSTFKLSTAAAGLAEGIITKDTKITDKGIYTYYPDYQPRCWIYVSSHATHGSINVVSAIQHSCNYFFYEVGRLLTIDKLNTYCRQFGLGELTGVEFAEPKGILAGPAYREDNGLDMWSPGDTLQAAIGQSDNAFTPLQLGVYMSTLVNGGARYRAHLLHSVHEYSGAAAVYTVAPEVISNVNLSEDNMNLLKSAMKTVIENGSAARLFRSYPVEMGGKTGTAQVSKTRSDNAIFIGFAPYENPEIAISCVIENGASGTDAGYAILDILDYYFKIDPKSYR